MTRRPRPLPIRTVARPKTRLRVQGLEDRSVPAAVTLAVTTTADAGPGSLRQAILDANANPGTDTIAFNIPGAGVHTIQPLSQLPTIIDPVIIDGYTQPGASPNTNGPGLGDNAVLQVELDGTYAGRMDDGPWPTVGTGLVISAGHSTVRGLVVNRFGVDGIRLTTDGGNTIEGNFIGTDPAGMVGEANYNGGLDLYNVGDGPSNGNTIGGLTPAARNVISGNNSVNIHIEPADGTVIQGNFIGTDATGAAQIGNPSPLRSGVFIFGGNDNVVGGITPEARNVISGNQGSSDGVEIYGTGNVVQGNYIGTDVTGTIAVPNTGGVLASGTAGAPANVVGGTAPGVGNLISGNTSGGVAVAFGMVQGNLIGTDVTGTHAIGNGGSAVGAYFATIGGTTAAARNVISGNPDTGVRIFDGSVVLGNYIGTDITGSKALGNGQGVWIFGTDPLVGGAEAGARNVIAGNGLADVRIQQSTGARVQGNYIGVDVSGNTGLSDPNVSGFGILVDAEVTDFYVGGSAAGAGNVIGSRNVGIAIHSTDTSGVVVRGNSIGVGADGHSAIPNGFGVWLFGGTANNTIGGAAAGDGNVIANSRDVGVELDTYYNAPITTGNTILGNSISNTQATDYANAGLGIDISRSNDLYPDGPNSNDSGDADAGNNNLQNYPVLTNVTNGTGATTIQGTLNSSPNSTFRIELFANSTVKANGYSEGEWYLGFTTVTTDASGNASFSVTLDTGSIASQYVTATATDAAGNTSEFSLAYQVPANSPPTAVAGGPYTVTYGDSLTLNAAESADPDNDSLSYSWTVNGHAGAATGANPTLDWAHLAALGLAPGNSYSVTASVDDGHGHTATSPAASIAVAKAPPVFGVFGTTVVTDGVPSVTLTGLLSYAGLAPTGAVMVTVDGVIRSATLGTDGRFAATFPTAALAIGVHAVQFDYGGDVDFTDAHASASLDVTFGVIALFNQQRAVHPGSTLPIQVALGTAGGQDVSSDGMTVTALGLAATTNTADTVGSVAPAQVGTLTAAQAAGNANPNNVFRYQGGSNPFYMYNLQVPADLAAGTYRLYFSVTGDPLDHWVTFTVS